MPCGSLEEEHPRLTAGKCKGPEIETSSVWPRNKGSIHRTAGTEASKVSKGDVEDGTIGMFGEKNRKIRFRFQKGKSIPRNGF